MGRTFMIPGEIISGKDALKDSLDKISRLGNKALIVTGKHNEKIGNVKKLTNLLECVDISYAIYSEITGEPTDVMIENGLALYKKEACDFLIAIGGGSPMDSMKAIAALISNPGEIADYIGKPIMNPVPPMAAIPTTAGTGSEATWFTIITDTKKDVKMLLKGEVLLPDLAIVDPEFTISAPPSVTAATGLDALTHAIESYTSKKAQSLTDIFAVSAVKRIFNYLPRAFHDGSDEEARTEMSLAALEAGICINNASVTIVHGMSRPIGALFHVPHGLSNAMLLKECFSFALDGAYDKFGALGRAIGVCGSDASDEEAANAFLQAVVQICKECKVPTLLEYGVDKESFYQRIDKMAEDAIASGSPANTLKAVTKEDVISIYKKLFV